ncbi:metal-sulfur cluster assembly factor [Candidatus Micrarchaeota archaeon]|nr:metal-sulfur cluster assembly factor [Candidatus Micrarchaeota archaeon]
MVTKEQVIEKLKTVFDPHIPISVYDLGLILDINIKEQNRVYIKMTFTTPACPMKKIIAQKVEDSINELDGVKEVKVELMYNIKWTPEMINPKFREDQED